MKRIRVGLVGGGFGGQFPWHKHPYAKLEAVAEADPARLESLRMAYGCPKAYASLNEIIKDPDVDAVAVFTPAPLHAEHSVACLEAGKHVFCAVPAAISVEDCERVIEAVEKTGLTYMMAETSYYYQGMITARKFYEQGRFGEIFYTEAEYHHAGLEALFYNPDGSRSWRYGFPPMLYPTHCTSFLTGLTGERMVDVYCLGWGNDAPSLQENDYANPFWNQTALFKTDRGHAFRVSIFWYGAHMGGERAQWYGDKMSFFMRSNNGFPPVIVRAQEETELDICGFERKLPKFEEYEQVKWYETEMLPESMRIDTGHDGSHAFLVHEFISALVEGRQPEINVYEAVAYTVPGIVANESSKLGGKQLSIPQFDK